MTCQSQTCAKERRDLRAGFERALTYLEHPDIAYAGRDMALPPADWAASCREKLAKPAPPVNGLSVGHCRTCGEDISDQLAAYRREYARQGGLASAKGMTAKARRERARKGGLAPRKPQGGK